MATRANSLRVSLWAGLWLATILAGYRYLLAYSARPGPTSSAPARVTEEIQAWHKNGRPLFILSLHPRCPCSRASVGELEDLLAWTPDASDLVVLVYKPDGEPDAWIPESSHAGLNCFQPRIVPDSDGQFAARLGAETSGHLVVYDGSGNLAFSGGLTSARGHRGPTPAQLALRGLLRGEAPDLSTAPTFGCALQDEDEGLSRKR